MPLRAARAFQSQPKRKAMEYRVSPRRTMYCPLVTGVRAAAGAEPLRSTTLTRREATTNRRREGNRRRPRATGGSHRRAESIAAGSLLASILPLIHLLRFRSIGPATPAAGSGDRAVEQRDETYRVEYLAAEPVLGADDQHQLLDLAATDRDHQAPPGANWSSNDCGTSVAAAVTMIPL